MDCRKQELSLSEIQQKVKEYNAQVNSNLFMVLVRNTFSVKDVNIGYTLFSGVIVTV